MAKGTTVFRPYALIEYKDLVNTGDDPIPAALRLLAAQQADSGERETYWQLLPQPTSADACTIVA